MDWRDHIITDPDFWGGKPTLKGTRLSVSFRARFAGRRMGYGGAATALPKSHGRTHPCRPCLCC